MEEEEPQPGPHAASQQTMVLVVDQGDTNSSALSSTMHPLKATTREKLLATENFSKMGTFPPSRKQTDQSKWEFRKNFTERIGRSPKNLEAQTRSQTASSALLRKWGSKLRRQPSQDNNNTGTLPSPRPKSAARRNLFSVFSTSKDEIEAEQAEDTIDANSSVAMDAAEVSLPSSPISSPSSTLKTRTRVSLLTRNRSVPRLRPRTTATTPTLEGNWITRKLSSMIESRQASKNAAIRMEEEPESRTAPFHLPKQVLDKSHFRTDSRGQDYQDDDSPVVIPSSRRHSLPLILSPTTAIKPSVGRGRREHPIQFETLAKSGTADSLGLAEQRVEQLDELEAAAMTTAMTPKHEPPNPLEFAVHIKSFGSNDHD